MATSSFPPQRSLAVVHLTSGRDLRVAMPPRDAALMLAKAASEGQFMLPMPTLGAGHEVYVVVPSVEYVDAG